MLLELIVSKAYFFTKLLDSRRYGSEKKITKKEIQEKSDA